MLPLNTMFVRPAGLFPAPGSPGTALCKQRMSSSVCLALVSRSRGPTGTCTTAKVLFLQVCLDRETPEGSEIWLRAPGITKDWKKKYIYTTLAASFLPVTRYGLHGHRAAISYPPSQFPLSRWLLLMHKA